MMKRSFISASVVWVVAVVAACSFCRAETEKNWAGELPLVEELWKEGELKDIDQKGLEEKMKGIPHWRMGADFWFVQEEGNLELAGEPLLKTLFHWEESEIESRAKKHDAGVGLVTRLKCISSVLYEYEPDTGNFEVERYVKSYSNFFGRSPKSSVVKVKQSDIQHKVWSWTTREGVAELWLSVEGKGRAEITKRAILTLTPERRERRKVAPASKNGKNAPEMIAGRSQRLEEALSNFCFINAGAKVKEPGEPSLQILLLFIAMESKFNPMPVLKNMGAKNLTPWLKGVDELASYVNSFSGSGSSVYVCGERGLSQYYSRYNAMVKRMSAGPGWKKDTIANDYKESDLKLNYVSNIGQEAEMKMQREVTMSFSYTDAAGEMKSAVVPTRIGSLLNTMKCKMTLIVRTQAIKEKSKEDKLVSLPLPILKTEDPDDKSEKVILVSQPLLLLDYDNKTNEFIYVEFCRNGLKRGRIKQGPFYRYCIF